MFACSSTVSDAWPSAVSGFHFIEARLFGAHRADAIAATDALIFHLTDLRLKVRDTRLTGQGMLEGAAKLAYEIGPHKEGTYVLETINGSGELMKEIDRRLKVSDLIIRHLVVRVDEEETVIERVRNRRTETMRRRRVARGLPPRPDPSERPATNDDDAGDLEGIEV